MPSKGRKDLNEQRALKQLWCDDAAVVILIIGFFPSMQTSRAATTSGFSAGDAEADPAILRKGSNDLRAPTDGGTR